MNRTLVKVSATKDCILFKTVRKDRKSPYWLAVCRSEWDEFARTGSLLSHDVYSFAHFHRAGESGVVYIRFTWLNGSYGALTGWEEAVTLPYGPLMEFVEHSAQAEEPSKWKSLSIEPQKRPRLVFQCPKKLHECLENSVVRRKLVRFLRDNFNWSGVEEIRFYSDFVPYSFTFREFRDGQPSMTGGLILHGQDDMEKAYYSIHT